MSARNRPATADRRAQVTGDILPPNVRSAPA